MRQALQHELAGATLIGTLHAPTAGRSGHESRFGLLMVNFAQAPRAGVGDLSAQIGDAVASLGMPAFRFDLPGLGDSVGEAPPVGQPLWEFIRAGGHVQWTSPLIDQLCLDHDLDGMVVGGLCAGAVTAMYTAAERIDRAAGLILLEPVFHQCDLFPEVDPIQVDKNGRPRNSAPIKPKPPGLRSKLIAKMPQGRTLRLARNLYARLKRLRRLLVTGASIPEDANRKALQSWKRITKAKLPTLLVNGAIDGREAYNRYYLGARFDKHVNWQVIRDTNHMMAANGGRQRVAKHLVDWIQAEFLAEQGRD